MNKISGFVYKKHLNNRSTHIIYIASYILGVSAFLSIPELIMTNWNIILIVTLAFVGIFLVMLLIWSFVSFILWIVKRINRHEVSLSFDSGQPTITVKGVSTQTMIKWPFEFSVANVKLDHQIFSWQDSYSERKTLPKEADYKTTYVDIRKRHIGLFIQKDDFQIEFFEQIPDYSGEPKDIESLPNFRRKDIHAFISQSKYPGFLWEIFQALDSYCPLKEREGSDTKTIDFDMFVE